MPSSIPTAAASAHQNAVQNAVNQALSQIFPKLPTSQSFSDEPPGREDHKAIYNNDLGGGLSPFTLQQIETLGNQLEELEAGAAEMDPPTDEDDEGSAELTDRQLHALDLVLQGLSDTRVAEAVGVSRRTIYNWRHSEDFENALRERRQMIHDAALDRMRSLLPDALDLLGRHLHEESNPLQAYRAASLVLHTAIRQMEASRR